MMGERTETQVAGIKFEHWADFIQRGCFAQNMETGEIKQISWNGYISNELTVRKAIASKFKLRTFRKK